ncbi:cellulase family glycosylhydrolase [Carboxylicivirga sp. N1Y90]|uniref:cellulase family glycosylhydrolase n=1 Tax=Carboxylicivirga fragile TaxID=3417571 RepID=UPI003D3263D3|nr:cellulase family glycosylhydrolase [Marinilabiliaceae bacterium N1Y90]
MMMVRYICLIIVAMQLIGCAACSKDKDVQKPAPVLKSSIPENNAVDVQLSTSIEIIFDEVISLASNHGISINGSATEVEASFTKLLFAVELQYETVYEITIPKGAVINTFGVPSTQEIQISFTTREAPFIDTEGMQFVASMEVGWNLGNTLDTKSEDETAWGNPLATKELIDAVSAKGFKTLRVPVTWQYHMGDAPDYTIDKQWLDRVEEVVNYALDNKMHVIVNIHHDEEWLIPTYAKLDGAKDQLEKVWIQIAERFKTYDRNLVFETLNETRLKGSAEEWTGGTAEGRDCINQFHDVAVAAIRNSGGNNTDRYIMVSPYAASSSQVAMDGLVLPNSSNLIVSVHNYFPYKFALAESDFNTTWGTDAEKLALDAELDRVVNKFIANGIPVVMGEWGNLNHDNLEERVKHAAYFANGCICRGICPIWWDNGALGHFGIINRDNYQWSFPTIADAIVNQVK